MNPTPAPDGNKSAAKFKNGDKVWVWITKKWLAGVVQGDPESSDTRYNVWLEKNQYSEKFGIGSMRVRT